MVTVSNLHLSCLAGHLILGEGASASASERYLITSAVSLGLRRDLQCTAMNVVKY